MDLRRCGRLKEGATAGARRLYRGRMEFSGGTRIILEMITVGAMLPQAPSPSSIA
jgi:hypothetical protein